MQSPEMRHTSWGVNKYEGHVLSPWVEDVRGLEINIANWKRIRDEGPSGDKWAYANHKVQLLRQRLRELEEG